MRRFRLSPAHAAMTATLLAFAGVLSAPIAGRTSPDGVWFHSSALPPEPPYQQRHSAVYDAARDRMMIIGGEGSVLAVWTLPLSGAQEVTRLAAAGMPPAWRQWFGAVYDPPGDRVIVFGGQTAGGQRNSEVWELGLGGTPAWTELHPAGPGPGQRYHHTAIFDPARRRMLIYGGQDSLGNKRREVWALELDGVPAWTLVKPATSPGPFFGSWNGVAVYDSRRDRLVVYDDSRLLVGNPGSMWSLPLAGGDWERLWNAGSGSAFDRFSAVYDSVGDRVVFFGETDLTKNRGLSFSLETKTWTEHAPAGPVQGRWESAVILDPVRRRIVIHGGWAGRGRDLDPEYPVGTDFAELALSDPLEWTRLAPPTPRARPVSRAFATSAFDPARGRCVFFGGQGVSEMYLNDTWATASPFGDAWDRLGPAGAGPRPSPREFAASFYDPVRDQFVVVGGPRAFSTASPIDGWALPAATNAWEPLNFSGTVPFGRQGHTVVYDAARDRAILFGGMVQSPTSSQTYNDVRELRLDPPGWVALAPSGTAPPSRVWHSAVYDPPRQRMLVFGGRNLNGSADRNLDDVWALSLGDSPAWTELAPSGGPVPIGQLSRAAFDSRRDRILLVTGDGAAAANPIWALDPVTLVWTRLAPEGQPPARRYGAMVEYDPGRDQLVLAFGGYPAPTDNHIWVLSFDPVTAVEVSLVGARALADRVELTWSVSDGSLRSARVWRHATDNEWRSIEEIFPDGMGRLEFVDREVSPGMRYGYRLEFRDGADDRFAGETWIEVPRRATLALAGVRPNPVGRELRVEFSLPDASPAALQLFDMAGRRLLAREVGSLGPGSHVANLCDARALAPGVYMVRLVRGVDQRTAQAIVTR